MIPLVLPHMSIWALKWVTTLEKREYLDNLRNIAQVSNLRCGSSLFPIPYHWLKLGLKGAI